MQLKEIRRIVPLHGTTTGASDTQALGSFDFATLAPNSGNPGTCIVDCTAHVVLNDSAGTVRTTKFAITWLDLAGSISVQVSGSPSYTITMPSALTWTFTFGTSGTVMTMTFSSPGGAGGVNAIASGWLELDVHY